MKINYVGGGIAFVTIKFESNKIQLKQEDWVEFYDKSNEFNTPVNNEILK